MTIDSAGNLYGVISVSIYEVVKGTHHITFLTTDGEVNSSDLTIDTNAETSMERGAGGIFELPKGGTSVVTLGRFAPGTGGNVSSLAIDAGGDLFGTGQIGLDMGFGDVFALYKGSTKTYRLVGLGGGIAFSAPIVDASGNLYIAANPGFYNPAGGNSSVFEVAAGSGQVTTLATFSSQVSVSTLIRTSSGDLYGSTGPGENGSNANATIFKIASGSGTVTTLASFTAGVVPSDANVRFRPATSLERRPADPIPLFELHSGSHSISTLVTFRRLAKPDRSHAGQCRQSLRHRRSGSQRLRHSVRSRGGNQ